MKRDLTTMLDVQVDILDILDAAEDMKKRRDMDFQPLKGKVLAMIFEKSSTRTRVSFEVGMIELGGFAVTLNTKDLQMGRGETVADTARVLSRYVDGIMYRAYEHEMVMELAKHATVPVINGLDNFEHPCQIMADLLTVKEHLGKLKGIKMAYVGDGNNVCNSLMLGCAMVGMDLSCGCPKGYEPDPGVVKKAKAIAKKNGCQLNIVESPKEAAKGADVVYTDVWVSMGQEEEQKLREKIFKPYQVNADLMSVAHKNAIVMHCLPAHRGMEITDEVIDSTASVVLDQAENRLHVQKAIMVALMG
ncbi:MAG TPA: ornithine carbamoyltransferase [Methanomassiliicoccales archaeon]|nr:ornithine carbamoyltransferase [Methanomassiliicoccales archaeon]HPR98449.1 ornithine carbamoyltransferase [Methanomassiliicoccales archaeon]